MTTPITAVVQGFRKYAVFGGRATRAEYWWWLLFTFIGSIVFIVIDSLIGFPRVWEYGLLETLFWLATLLPSITVVTRRCMTSARPAGGKCRGTASCSWSGWPPA